jgi:hypothetical protein
MSDRERFTTRFFGDLSRPPDGRPQNLVWLCAATLFYLLTAYYLAVGRGVTPFTPLFGTAFALNGLAESLSDDRRQIAYLVRVLSIVFMLALLVLLLVGTLGGPELLVQPGLSGTTEAA